MAALSRTRVVTICAGLLLALLTVAFWPRRARAAQESSLAYQSAEDVAKKSAGCITCHTTTDEPTMHATGTVHIGCTDCHGGNAAVGIAAGTATDSAEYRDVENKAHVLPRLGDDREHPGEPKRAYARWLEESPEYVRFVNPGDLRVAMQTCGASGCHAPEVKRVRSSMMTHGAMLWSAALYNNGAFAHKDPHFGESYDESGKPVKLVSDPPPTSDEIRTKGVLPQLEPLPRWETSLPGNVLRVFEKGGERRSEVGNPDTDDAASGRPDLKLSDRGFGTNLRTDPVFLGLQKTRLFDPLLSFPGTNDQPGDYRGSGCTACHVVYANDRSPLHSGSYAKFGNGGTSASNDPTIHKDEGGHPIQHRFTLAVPSSQCMVCHMHPGTNMEATYFGYTWWDNEVDAQAMYPREQRKLTDDDAARVEARNPEAAALRGLWSDVEFLKQTGSPEFNAKLQQTRFGDFHSHGWIFRAVFKHDRHGNLLDADGNKIDFSDPQRFEKAVQLADIHMEKGMHCIDCHFTQDEHGNGRLYGETRNAVEIGCSDCHGTIRERASLLTSGPAAPTGGTPLAGRRTPWGVRQFYWRDGQLIQRSLVEPDKEWEVVQVVDTITPGSAHYSESSRLAKTMQKDGTTWGSAADDTKLAHSTERFTCQSCHTSWAPNCFGCHLGMTANQRKPMLHNEGLLTRNWTSYNFQVLRDDAYMLGIDGTVTGNKISPVRSACAVLVSSQNQNRDWIYYTQQTVSAEGFSGQAFSPFVPHTVRAKETKRCTDCHVSQANDNNAWLAHLLLQGTNFVNYMGQYVYVATGDGGFEAVSVSEHDDPQAIFGSDLQRVAYPADYRQHESGGGELKEAFHHAGKPVLDVQSRGEYLYAAMGKEGFRVFDVANIDNKDISERMVTAPVSPLGQKFYVKTRDAAAVATPSTLALDPTRVHLQENEEQAVHPMYAYLYVADREDGLVVVGAAKKSGTPGVSTLLDGNPENNYLARAATFNPDGALKGAHRITIAGTYGYILCDAGLVIVDLNDPLHPQITSRIGTPELNDARGIQLQFRYAFVVDRDGLKVLDATDLAHPKLVPAATVPLRDARNLYLARTYAYVADGAEGLAIVDIERPEHPALDQLFKADGKINDLNDVKTGMTNSSLFAYLADGKNGLRIVQLFSPDSQPAFAGFSPRPAPKLIASFRTHKPALAISEGIDRDRAVDENGNQLAVFGRRGARPFNADEMRRLYLRDGKVFTVTDAPPGPPQP